MTYVKYLVVLLALITFAASNTNSEETKAKTKRIVSINN